MASPSVALLSALVTGAARPKRMLVQADAPAFISNIGRIAGATPVHVPPGEIDRTLRRLNETEGIGSDHVWAVVTHRDAELAPSEWSSACLAYGVPTIELCLGSLFALARRSPSSSTFTIVSLDSEVALAGTHLTALLTSDEAVAQRIRQLCLPGPEATDYVLDASPRGLAHDESALLALVEAALASAETEAATAPKKPASESPSSKGFGLAWNRRFQAEESETQDSDPERLSALVSAGKNPWLARLAESAMRHEESRRTAAAQMASLQAVVESMRSAQDDLLARCDAAERRADGQTELLSALQAESQDALEGWRREKADLERAVSLREAANEALAKKLTGTERARDLDLAAAVEREEALQSALEEQRRRTASLQQDASALIERQTKRVEIWETSRTELTAHIALLEQGVRNAERAHAELQARKVHLERELNLVTTQKEDLSKSLAQAEKTHQKDLQAAEARLAEGWRARLESAQQATEALKTAHAAREAQLVAGWETSRAELLAQKAQRERDLDSVTAERENLSGNMVRIEEEHKRELAAAKAHLDEFRMSAQAEMARAAESWRIKLQSAEQATEALEMAVAARTSEAGAYEKTHEMWKAHRLSLEEQIAQLHQALEAAHSTAPPPNPVEPASPVEPLDNENKLPRPPQREPAPWEAQPPRFAASPGDSDRTLRDGGGTYDLPATDFAESTTPSDAFLSYPRASPAEGEAGFGRSGPDGFADLPGPPFTPEYEENASEPEEGSANSLAWLRGVADRIRRA